MGEGEGSALLHLGGGGAQLDLLGDATREQHEAVLDAHVAGRLVRVTDRDRDRDRVRVRGRGRVRGRVRVRAPRMSRAAWRGPSRRGPPIAPPRSGYGRSRACLLRVRVRGRVRVRVRVRVRARVRVKGQG